MHKDDFYQLRSNLIAQGYSDFMYPGDREIAESPDCPCPACGSRDFFGHGLLSADCNVYRAFARCGECGETVEF